MDDYQNHRKSFDARPGRMSVETSGKLNARHLRGGGLTLRLKVASSAEVARNALRLALSHT